MIKRLLMVMVVVAMMASALHVGAPVAWAADVEGKIKAIDPTGRMVTLEDGTMLMIPATVRIAREELKPGADVKASYEDKGNQKIVTTIQVVPAR